MSSKSSFLHYIRETFSILRHKINVARNSLVTELTLAFDQSNYLLAISCLDKMNDHDLSILIEGENRSNISFLHLMGSRTKLIYAEYILHTEIQSKESKQEQKIIELLENQNVLSSMCRLSGDILQKILSISPNKSSLSNGLDKIKDSQNDKLCKICKSQELSDQLPKIDNLLDEIKLVTGSKFIDWSKCKDVSKKLQDKVNSLNVICGALSQAKNDTESKIIDSVRPGSENLQQSPENIFTESRFVISELEILVMKLREYTRDLEQILKHLEELCSFDFEQRMSNNNIFLKKFISRLEALEKSPQGQVDVSNFISSKAIFEGIQDVDVFCWGHFLDLYHIFYGRLCDQSNKKLDSIFNVIKFLLLNHQIEIKDDSGRNAVIYAISLCPYEKQQVMWEEVIEPLLERYADLPLKQDKTGNTILHYAVAGGFSSSFIAVKIAGRYPELINTQNKEGNLPKHLCELLHPYHCFEEMSFFFEEEMKSFRKEWSDLLRKDSGNIVCDLSKIKELVKQLRKCHENYRNAELANDKNIGVLDVYRLLNAKSLSNLKNNKGDTPYDVATRWFDILAQNNASLQSSLSALFGSLNLSFSLRNYSIEDVDRMKSKDFDVLRFPYKLSCQMIKNITKSCANKNWQEVKEKLTDFRKSQYDILNYQNYLFCALFNYSDDVSKKNLIEILIKSVAEENVNDSLDCLQELIKICHDASKIIRFYHDFKRFIFGSKTTSRTVIADLVKLYVNKKLNFINLVGLLEKIIFICRNAEENLPAMSEIGLILFTVTNKCRFEDAREYKEFFRKCCLGCDILQIRDDHHNNILHYLFSKEARWHNEILYLIGEHQLSKLAFHNRISPFDMLIDRKLYYSFCNSQENFYEPVKFLLLREHWGIESRGLQEVDFEQEYVMYEDRVINGFEKVRKIYSELKQNPQQITSQLIGNVFGNLGLEQIEDLLGKIKNTEYLNKFYQFFKQEHEIVRKRRNEQVVKFRCCALATSIVFCIEMLILILLYCYSFLSLFQLIVQFSCIAVSYFVSLCITYSTIKKRAFDCNMGMDRIRGFICMAALSVVTITSFMSFMTIIIICNNYFYSSSMLLFIPHCFSIFLSEATMMFLPLVVHNLNKSLNNRESFGVMAAILIYSSITEFILLTATLSYSGIEFLSPENNILQYIILGSAIAYIMIANSVLFLRLLSNPETEAKGPLAQITSDAVMKEIVQSNECNVP